MIIDFVFISGYVLFAFRESALRSKSNSLSEQLTVNTVSGCCPSARAYNPVEEGGKVLNKKTGAESIWGNVLLHHSASAHPGGWFGGLGVGIMQKQTGYRRDTGKSPQE